MREGHRGRKHKRKVVPPGCVLVLAGAAAAAHGGPRGVPHALTLARDRGWHGVSFGGLWQSAYGELCLDLLGDFPSGFIFVVPRLSHMALLSALSIAASLHSS